MKIKSILMMLVAASAASVEAAPLAGQAGSDTVKRAQTPQAVASERETPEAKPAAEAAKPSAKDAIEIGVIETLNLTGDAAFIEEESVAELLAPALCDGAVKTVGDLKAAIAGAKSELIDRGYYLIYIFPPSNDAYHADAKTLDLFVEPGRFGDIRATMKNNDGKGSWFWEDQIYRRFKYIEKDEPFNYRKLRQALRMLNGHPDLCAETKLTVRNAATNASEVAASAMTRYVDTDLEVDDSFPFHASIEFNNYQLDELDNWQMILNAQYLNLTGADDVLTISPAMSLNAEMWSIAGSYVRPFDWLLGGSWSVYGGYSSMDCDDVLVDVELLGTGVFAGFNSSWNLWDDEKRNLAFNLGLQWRLIEDEWSVISTDLSDRELNILPLTVGLSYADKRRDWLGGLDYFSLGESFELLGGEDNFREYSELADPNYMIFRTSWARLQPLIGPSTDGDEWRCWSWFHKVEGQYSAQDLITAERLAYGGNACLRGYRRRAYLGDNGVYGTIELRTPVFCDPVTALFRDSTGKSPIERIQLYTFTDLGYLAYNREYVGMDQEEFLWSAGVGIRAGLTQYLSVNFDVALPLRKGYQRGEDKDCELYLSVRLQY